MTLYYIEDFYWSMEKQREHRKKKKAFKTLRQFVVWSFSEGKWKTMSMIYASFSPNCNQFLQVSNSNLFSESYSASLS